MNIDQKLQSLRLTLRANSKNIIDKVIDDHNVSICMFCGSKNSLTKEHVIPRWVFDRDTKSFFTTTMNGGNQTFNKTTIPACNTCNSDLLSTLEKSIKELFDRFSTNGFLFNDEEKSNIIRWLEIIDYKYQVLNMRRKFLTSKESGYIPYLRDFPVSMLRLDGDFTPSKVYSEIRRSQKRVTIKSKKDKVYSLITFKTSNPDFHFFHRMDDFIFLELPRFKVAIFHFYKKEFNNELAAYEDAMNLIQTIY